MNPIDILVEISKSFQEKLNMFQILGHDCKELYKAIRTQKDSQIYRRAYVRAVFAFIEGVIHRTKVTTVHFGRLLGSLSIRELNELKGIKLDVNDTDEVTSKPLLLSLKRNIKLTFKTSSKSVGSPFNLNLSGKRWKDLSKAILVRDRLMHPKEIIDLQVTDTEIEETRNAFEWFMYSYNLSGYYMQKTIQSKTSASVEEVAALEATIHKLETGLALREN